MVVAHHHETDYREQSWPTCLLAGSCARWVQAYLDGAGPAADPAVLDALGIPADKPERVWERCEEQIEELRELAKSLAEGR